MNVRYRLTGVYVRQYPVNELTEDLSRFLHRLVVLCRAATTSNSREQKESFNGNKSQ